MTDTQIDKKAALALISEQLRLAETAISKAEDIALANGIDSFSWSGPSYGMGGYWDDASEYDTDPNSWMYEEERAMPGWRASSQSC